ncbi:hypothetical protein [Streptomyces flaveus]|nr:hypothetical protein [Streptomyces flaveus]
MSEGTPIAAVIVPPATKALHNDRSPATQTQTLPRRAVRRW